MKKRLFGLLFIVGLFLLNTGYLLGQKPEKSLNNPQVLPKSISLTTPITLYPTQVLGTQVDSYRVVKIIDGDTIDIEINGVKETVRLIGIDTPETVDPRKPVQCFGRQASDKAKEMLNDKNIYLESDPTQGDKDKYNRLLRFVFLEDKTNFNELMIREGYAHEYTYRTPYKYQKEFKEAEEEARDSQKGLWSPTACSQSLTNPTFDKDVSSVQAPVVPNGKYACECTKLCFQIKTCDEAYYQLNNCGCTKRDADSDGIPCESLCR